MLEVLDARRRKILLQKDAFRVPERDGNHLPVLPRGRGFWRVALVLPDHPGYSKRSRSIWSRDKLIDHAPRHDLGMTEGEMVAVGLEASLEMKMAVAAAG